MFSDRAVVLAPNTPLTVLGEEPQGWIHALVRYNYVGSFNNT